MPNDSFRQRYAAFEARVLACLSPGERRSVLALDASLRRHATRLAIAATGFVFFLALGLYVFGDGKIGVVESLVLSSMLAVSLVSVVVGSWVRPSAFSAHPWRRIVLMTVVATAGGAVGAFAVAPDGWPSFVATMRRVGPAVVFGASATGLFLASLATGLALLRRREIDAVEARLRSEADARLREEQLAHRAAEAQLAALRAQVEPHFLFNSLAALVELAEPGSPRAAALGRHLVDFLRGSLGTLRVERTTVGADVDLARAYLEVMAIRLGPRFSFAIDLPAALRDHALPAAMTISLVENAIKHGIEPSTHPSSITLRARVDATHLVLDVDDTGRGVVATDATGFGLVNLRERLRLQFGTRAELTLVPNAPRGTRARLRIPLDEEPS